MKCEKCGAQMVTPIGPYYLLAWKCLKCEGSDGNDI